jgi:hypothetical protein
VTAAQFTWAAANFGLFPLAQLEMKASKSRTLLLEHYEVDVSELRVFSSLAGPVACGRKEPVGVGFHTAILRQQGLIGASGGVDWCMALR